jgi:hypothetical protein
MKLHFIHPLIHFIIHACVNGVTKIVKKEGIYIKASNWLWHGHMQTNQINKQLLLMSSHLHQKISKIPRL